MEIGLKNSIDVKKLYFDNKNYVLSISIYVFGLFLGSVISSKLSLYDYIKDLFLLKDQLFLQVFINKMSAYIFVYCLTVLFGLCIVGFPFINVMPLIIGFETAIKISFYYTQYASKGFGFCLLLICPESACFMTVLLYSITNSNILSRLIFNTTTKNSDTLMSTDIKMYLKNYLIYFVCVIFIALFNALIEYLLKSIVSI